jgi:hypothetical protein
VRDQPEGALDDREEAVGIAHQVVGLALGDGAARTRRRVRPAAGLARAESSAAAARNAAT